MTTSIRPVAGEERKFRPAGAGGTRKRQRRVLVLVERRPIAGNLRDAFCSEIDDGWPVPPLRLIDEIGRRHADADDIRGAVVTFSNGKREFSTLFPDSCGVEQLVRSIERAKRSVIAIHDQ